MQIMCSALNRLLERRNPDSVHFDGSFAGLQAEMVASRRAADDLPEKYHLADKADYIEIVLLTLCDKRITQEMERERDFARNHQTISALSADERAAYAAKYPALHRYLTELDRICSLVK